MLPSVASRGGTLLARDSVSLPFWTVLNFSKVTPKPRLTVPSCPMHAAILV